MSNGDSFPTLIEGRRLDPSLINGVDQAALTIGAARDATIAFEDEIAANRNVLGVYLIDDDGTIRDPEIVFARIEHADAIPGLPFARPGGGPLEPGEAVRLSELYGAGELEPGQRFGLFLIQDGARLNPSTVFDETGRLEFVNTRTGAPANVADDASEVDLRHVTDDGTARPVRGGVFHTADDDLDPLTNDLNDTGLGRVISGIEPTTGGVRIGFEDSHDFDFSDLLVRVGAPPPVEPIPQLTARLTELQVGRAAEDGFPFDFNAEWVLPISAGGRIFTFRNDSVDDGDSFRFDQQLVLSRQSPLGNTLTLSSGDVPGQRAIEDDPGPGDDFLPESDVELQLNSAVDNLLVRTTAEGGEDVGAITRTPLDARYALSWEIDFGGPRPPPIEPLPDLGQLTVRLTGLAVDNTGPLDDDPAAWALDILAAASGGGRNISDRFAFREDLNRRDPNAFEFDNELVLTGQVPVGTEVRLSATGREDDPVFDDILPESGVRLTLNSEVEDLRLTTFENEGTDVGLIDNPGRFSYSLSWEVDFLFAERRRGWMAGHVRRSRRSEGALGLPTESARLSRAWGDAI